MSTTEVPTVDLHKLEDEIIKLAEERPEHTYEGAKVTKEAGGCSYVGTKLGVVGGEGCIVGQALMRLGVSEDYLREIEAGAGSLNAKELLSRGRRLFNTENNDSGTMRTILLVQGNQDDGLTWGESVRRVQTGERDYV